MKLYNMIKILQTKNKGKIIICNSGNFYIAVGKDAVLLNKILGLKVNCLKLEICKVGFPIIALEKYTDLIQEKGYSYIVYYFDQKTEEIEILREYEGKKQNEIKEENIECSKCPKRFKYFKENDKYSKALEKLYKKEEENNAKI